jgi:glycosidase
LPANPNYTDGVNVVAQEADPNSLLSFYRNMLSVRRSTPALIAGDYRELDPHSEAYFAFLRHDPHSEQTCLVALNLSDEAQTVSFNLDGKQPRLLFAHPEREHPALSLDQLTLAPFEILVAELN